jgi:hypothetical protein
MARNPIHLQLPAGMEIASAVLRFNARAPTRLDKPLKKD